MPKRLPTLPLAAFALALPALAQAQDYSDLPPLAPLSEAEVRTLPPEYRTAPAAAGQVVQTTETVTNVDGVETITRTRRIELPAEPAQGAVRQTYGYAPAMAYAPAPVVFERDQWIEECRRRTAGRSKNDTGTIIGGLLGAIAGGFAGYEIAGAGDRVLGTALGIGGGSLLGGLIGSLFNGDKKKNLYDCEAALDSYLTQYGAPTTRIASRTIPYAPYPSAPAYTYGYGYPASYGYSYAPPPQMVMVPVRSEMQQQVVVRETVREESYTVPGAARMIPAPSPKMIKLER
ncbi:hypothetical protein [Erythrobacter dokdonensis]|uniref:17 kDa surface antigen n=1 Tax=Erythrobacter dokdonensis DSW-74 TaxID=1300349 RepID=A0A1A7BDZ2_9SPHN|nr:hypothetical protein [Erythrobacter dokdonensis]OBV10753.1 hypothetical protein I603_1966 [Erythrobacter dokdonensis DSW-74]